MGELVEFAGVSRQTIHNYTTMGLLPEAHWTPGGHRCYDASAFERLEQIAAMKAADKTLTEIRDYFAGMDTDTL
ncbi:MAG: MerR family transcriptional regulator [Phycisphaerae bacterium]|nr:MerR family transcriptional regulator [Phycisphaerae bacterium]